MAQIIPALIVADTYLYNDFEELKDKFEKIKPFLADLGGWIQVDITDGEFVTSKTNLGLEELAYFTKSANVEFHLMVLRLRDSIDRWIGLGPKRREMRRLTILLFFAAATLISSDAFALLPRIAIIIGNNHGSPTRAPLRFAEQDARKVQATLLQVGNFSASNTHLLLGKDRNAVLTTLKNLSMETTTLFVTEILSGWKIQMN